MKKIIMVTLLLISSIAMAGGRNDQVPYPEGYKDTFTYYNTQNRANNKQIADMYANDTAMKSINDAALANGSIIVMEIHKPEVDESGSPIIDDDGLFVKKQFAAVAVMEKRDDWDAGYAADERAGAWGFALYDTRGMPKENSLDCATCHQPLTATNFMFTFPKLKEMQ